MSARAIERHAWPAVLVLAVLVRVGTLVAFPDVFDFVRTGTMHGSDAYDAYARNLLATGVYGREAGVADAALPPAYSVVLAGAYAIGGRSALTVAVVHTLCDLLSMVLLRRLAIALLSAPLVGTLAAAGMACYPYLVFQSLAVNDTALFILQLHLLAWAIVRVRDASSSNDAARLAIGAGVACGLAVLTRPVAWPLLAWAAAWWWLHLPSRRVATLTLGATLASGLVVGAWTARNHAAFGVPVVLATNGGSNFWQGNNALARPYLDAGYDVQWIPAGDLAAIDHRDPRSNGAFLAAGLRFLREHPAEIPRLVWAKLRTHWSLDITPRRNPSAVDGAARGRDRVFDAGTGAVTLSGLAREDAVSAYSQPLFERYGRLVHRTFWGLALSLACIGAIATRHAWRALSLVWFVQINMTLAYVVFHPSTRYRLPSDPLLLVVSAAGLVALTTWGQRAWRAARGAAPRDTVTALLR